MPALFPHGRFRRLASLSRALSAVALVLVANAASAEIKITDVLGRSVTLQKPAQRVMLGFYFEDYAAIVGPGAFDRLAAVSLYYWKGYRPGQYDTYVKAFPQITRLTDVGNADQGTMSVESIVAAQPDVAILSAGQYKYLGAAAQKIDAAGIPVVVVDYNAQTLAMHVASTEVIGKVMGTEARAQRLNDRYVAAVEDTAKRVRAAGTAHKPKVYVELGQKGAAEYGNSYGKGMWAGVLDAAGAANIAADKIAGFGPLTSEYVLSAEPEVIFITGSEWTSIPGAVLMGFGIGPDLTRERVKPYFGRLGWSDLPAVKNSRVYAVYHGGTRTMYDYAYLRFIAKALYPAAFHDVDPDDELKAYYREYLPIEPQGSFMVHVDPRK